MIITRIMTRDMVINGASFLPGSVRGAISALIDYYLVIITCLHVVAGVISIHYKGHVSMLL